MGEHKHVWCAGLVSEIVTVGYFGMVACLRTVTKCLICSIPKDRVPTTS